MKQTLLIAFLIVFTSLISCSENGGQKTPKVTKKNVLVIRKALYGNLPDGMMMDVTDKVRKIVKDSTLSIMASDDNLGDPYKGTLKLRILRADVHVPYLNLSGENGAGDITSTIRQFQVKNYLITKMTGDTKVTVYYRYGNGKISSKEQAKDGMIVILPPTKLRVDYTANGVDLSKTVDINNVLNAKNKDE